MAAKKEKFLTYRGKPLIRSGNTIYYGDMTDPYVAVLQISETKDFKDLELPTRISVQILSTDESLPLLERIKKNTEKRTFYDAMNIASIWLERILATGDAGDDE